MTAEKENEDFQDKVSAYASEHHGGRHAQHNIPHKDLVPPQRSDTPDIRLGMKILLFLLSRIPFSTHLVDPERALVLDQLDRL
jgi:hypothetical protein